MLFQCRTASAQSMGAENGANWEESGKVLRVRFEVKYLSQVDLVGTVCRVTEALKCQPHYATSAVIVTLGHTLSCKHSGDNNRG